MRRMTFFPALGAIVSFVFVLPSPCFAGPGRPTAATEMYWGRKDMDKGHWSGALSHFRKAVARDPHRSDAYAEMGRAYKHLGDIQRSRESFLAALKLDPHNDQAETGLHDVMTADEHTKLLADLEVQARNSPLDANVQTSYAEELFEQKRFDDAAAAAKKALSLNAKESHACGVLGLVALQQNQPEEARKMLKAAIAGDDSDDDSWAGLGDLAMSEKDYPNAVICYRNAVKAARDHAEWHEKLAGALLVSGDANSASAETGIARNIRADTKGANSSGGAIPP